MIRSKSESMPVSMSSTMAWLVPWTVCGSMFVYALNESMSMVGHCWGCGDSELRVIVKRFSLKHCIKAFLLI